MHASQMVHLLSTETQEVKKFLKKPHVSCCSLLDAGLHSPSTDASGTLQRAVDCVFPDELFYSMGMGVMALQLLRDCNGQLV
jgi:hypothetical protein